MTDKLNKKLFFKILIIILLTVLAPISIIGTYSYIFSQIYAEDAVINSNTNTLTYISDTLELILNEIDAISMQYSFDRNILQYYKDIVTSQDFNYENMSRVDELNTNIRLTINSKPYIKSVYIYYNNEGGYFLSSDKGLQNINGISDNSWYDSFLKRAENISVWTEIRNIYDRFTENNTAVISIIRAIPIESIEKKGVIVVNLDMDYFSKMVKNIEKNKLKYFFVADSTGDIITGSSTQTRSLPASLMEQIFQNNNKYYFGSFEGEQCLISHIASKFYNWKYITITPLNMIYEEPTRIRKITFVIITVSLLLGTAIALSLSKAFYIPVKKMVSMIMQAQTGNEIPNIEIKNKDEYDYIAYNLLQGFLNQKNLQKEIADRALKLKEAEMLALQSQINPHFLFNTLESVNWTAIKFLGDENDISFLTSTLSDLLRYSINDPDILVNLEEEIEHAENYIKMLSYRYRNRFDVKWNIDKRILCQKTIKLLLQPLIENAIYHGIKETTKNGHIRISGRLYEDKIELCVFDNGKGMHRDKLAKLRAKLDETQRTQYDHIGIFNVNQRLRLKFGDRYGLQIRSKENWGTLVKVSLPNTKIQVAAP